MVVSLLERDGKVTSLEFDKDDLEKVGRAIADQFCEIRIFERAPTYNEVEFGGEHFTHYHEWTPCLLPRTQRGENMLRMIALDFR